MRINNVLEMQLELIRPSSNEIKEYESISKEVVKKVSSKGLKLIVGGSLAKGTMIRKVVQDIDIFAVFDSVVDFEKLERLLKKKGFDYSIVHGSRDYFHINFEKQGVVVELIPVLKNEFPEEAENVTDVSLKHVDYVRGEISKDKKIADEIRLAKAFCKAQKCYGAESYVRGFSGYLLEVLVIHFGSFVNFLKKVGKKEFYDSKNYFKNERIARMEINASKLVSPIVVVDPTYKYRNIAAGLGEETYTDFLRVAKDFLKKPSLDFFEKKEIDVDKLKELGDKEGNVFLELELSTDRQEGDIAGTKMKKFFDFICEGLGRKGQKVLEKVFDYSGSGQGAKGYIVFRECKEIIVEGPPKSMKDAVKRFKAARKKVKENRGKFYAFEKFNLKELFNSFDKVGEEMGARVELI